MTLLIAGPGRAEAQTGDLSYLAADGVAHGLTARYAIDGYLPVSQLVDVSTSFATARLELQRSTSLAAMPYPGDTLVNLPSTVSGLAQLPNLPPYPLAARAEDPGTPESEVSLAPGDDDVGAASLRAEAHSSDAKATASLVSSAIPGLVTVEAVESTVDVKRDGDNAEVRARSVLSGVEIADGLVLIGSVETNATVAGTPGDLRVVDSDITVTNVTVAGQAAHLGHDGIHIVEPVDPGLLEAPTLPEGLSLRLTSGEVDSGDDSIRASGGAVVLTVESTVQGAPTTFEVLLGSTTASLRSLRARPLSPQPAPNAQSPSVPPGPGRVNDALQPKAVSHPPQGANRVAVPPSPTAATPSLSSATAPTAPVAFVLDFRPVYLPLVLLGAAVVAIRRRLTRVAGPINDVRPLWRW